MKYHTNICRLALFLCALALAGCGGANKKNAETPAAEQNFDADASYALGMDVASSIKGGGVSPDLDAFFKGFTEVMRGDETRFSEEEAGQKIQEAFMSMMEKANEGLKQAETEFLAENSKKAGVVITGSGLQYEVLSQGNGPSPAATDVVRVNYEGTFTDGSVFDSSYSRGEPTEFPLNGVISGWTEGIQLMSVGSKYRFYVPSELGYGPRGSGPIPPYSPLIFEVELLAIVEPEQ